MWKKKLAIAEIGIIVILLAGIGILYVRNHKPAHEESVSAVSRSVSQAASVGAEAGPEEEAPGEAGDSAVQDTSTEDAAAGSAGALSEVSTPAGEPGNTEAEAVKTESSDTAAVSQDGLSPQGMPAEDPYADKPDIDINSWEFILANYENNIEEYVPETAEIEGIELDVRIIDAMTAFVADCRAAGNSVVLASGYRDYYTQQYLFQLECTMYDEETAATIVARPGTSEHQTGLAADITDDYYEYKTSDLQYTAMYQWMAAHCQEYGFIVRFPEGKEDITRIIYEPWHFRYVGMEAATYIMEHDLTLEEFIELYK